MSTPPGSRVEPDFRGARVAVAGMARSGAAVADFLASRGARVWGVDAKPASELNLAGIDFRLQSPTAFDGAEWIVVSPGVPADRPELEAARRRGVKVIGEVELAGYFLQGPIIGITGANGKTTTTALAGHILRECGIPVQVGGNIGNAATGLIASSRPEQWNVLELSSFQLETVERFRARVAVALNVTPDHLDRHGSFENYARAKGRLFEAQAADDFAVLNADDPTCIGYAARAESRPVWFSTARPVDGYWADHEKLYSGGEAFLCLRDIPLRGRHNVENVLASAAAAHLAGAPLEAIAAAVKTFPGVEHRLEFVRALRGVEFYNDSKATNVDATLKALDAFPGGLWVILGGKDKGSDYTPLRDPLRRKARAALLVGAAADKIAGQLGDAVRLVQAGTIEQAAGAAWREAAPGEIVLLAPACASFDQFDNYEHRGRVFKEIVGRLG